MNLKEWRKLLPEVTGGLVRMRKKALNDGTIDSKYKLLIAISLAISQKCEPCIISYLEKAQGKITDEELKETLEVVIMFLGCVGEQWAKKTWDYWKKLVNDDKNSCCEGE
ncbi:carboxymuconolactone decarboxylase family protein [Thermosipho atlanticus]|uniref:Alkylhydroperoxidase AhpD family core domain-containing protein n=1 Tax=Thermosipho atlanticus DSM 15807 TaxID=1123380 RepID=A0A1M5TZU1_9BACT|nr:carboxymuconolactone decarboxylase family protein [Thermosipho atlanticus]SHH56151.1 alkylhydroperoxidase AhpD family core domain-containing protein [Thermosipho atlanticus DSM 15807]